MRPFRPGDRRLDAAQVQLEDLRVRRLAVGVVPHALLFGVSLDQLDLVFGAAGQPQVVARDGVDGEDRAGGPVLRTHIADGGPVGQRHVGHPGTEEFDEFADHAGTTQQLGHGQHQVGGRGAGR